MLGVIFGLTSLPTSGLAQISEPPVGMTDLNVNVQEYPINKNTNPVPVNATAPPAPNNSEVPTNINAAVNILTGENTNRVQVVANTTTKNPSSLNIFEIILAFGVGISLILHAIMFFRLSRTSRPDT